MRAAGQRARAAIDKEKKPWRGVPGSLAIAPEPSAFPAGQMQETSQAKTERQLGFLSARLGELLKAQHERGQLHRRALDRLYVSANEYLNDISEMIRRADLARGGAKRGELSWKYPYELTIDRTYYGDLLDSELVDLLLRFNIMIARYNRLVVDLRQMSFNVQDAYVASRVQEEFVAVVREIAGRDLNTIEVFLRRVDDHARDLAVRADLLRSQFAGRKARLYRMIGILRVWPLEQSAVVQERHEFDEGIERSRKRTVKEELAKVASIDNSES
jgi:hypothetical protein